MDVQQLLTQATDTVTVKRVFGEPIERDGTMIIPVARVRGGAGGGRGAEAGGDTMGSGGGFGFLAGPAGVYSVRDGVVTWQPAMDINRIVLGGQLVGVALLLVVRSILTHRRRT